MAAAVDAGSTRVSPAADAIKDVDLCSGEDDDVIFVAVTHKRARKRTRTRPPSSPPSDVIVIEDDPAPCPSHSEMNKRPVLLDDSGHTPAKRPKLSAGSAEPSSTSSCVRNGYVAALSPRMKTPPSFSSAPEWPLTTPVRHTTPPAVSPCTSPPRFGSRSSQVVRENDTPCSSRSASQLSRKPMKLRRTSDSPSCSQNSPTSLPTPRTLFSRESVRNTSSSSPGTVPRTNALQPSSPSSPSPHLSNDHRNAPTETPLSPLSSPHIASQKRCLEEGTPSLCIKQENASSEDNSNYSKPVPSVQLAPSFCTIPSCSTSSSLQQYGRTEKAYLEVDADIIDTMAGGRRYLSLLEKLLCHGKYIPSQQLEKTLMAVLKLSCSDHLRQAQRVLHNDLSIRQETTVPENCMWQLVERCINILQQEGGKAVSLMVAEVVLSYLFGLLVKDFNTKTENPKSSLVEKALSLTRHWPRVTKILDFLFAIHERGSPREPCAAPDLGEVVLSLACLPLLTCSRLEQRDQATRLAREFSERLGKLTSVEKRKQLLLSLPSHYLRELVLDLHLEAHCALSAAVAQDSESRALSIAKIGCVHLKRGPYYHDGRPHDDPGYFLFQLCHLLQSHIHNLEGAGLLSFLVPSTPGAPLPSEWLVYPPRPPRELQESLWDLGQQVRALIEQLTQDPVLLISITEGENWLYLQLLQALTNQPRNF